MSNKVADLTFVRKELFNLKELLQSIVDEFKLALNGSGLSFTLATEGVEDAIITDPNILGQIITKLLGYIIERMPDGIIQILIESNFCEPDSLLILIEGHELFIPEVKLTRLFSRQGSDLAKVKFLTKQLNGSIKAENGIGKGTTFVVLLPVKYLPSPELLKNLSNAVH